MPGFNFTPPPGPLPPMANLAQLALASFRPPGVMNMPMNMPTGMPGMPGLQQTPGFNVQDGMSKLGTGGLAALKGMMGPKGGVTASSPQGTGPGGAYTQADAMAMYNAANGGVSPVGPQGTGAGGAYTTGDAMSMFNGANGGGSIAGNTGIPGTAMGSGDPTGFSSLWSFLTGGGSGGIGSLFGGGAGDAAGGLAGGAGAFFP
jgi:hypothetical protein